MANVSWKANNILDVLRALQLRAGQSFTTDDLVAEMPSSKMADIADGLVELRTMLLLKGSGPGLCALTFDGSFESERRPIRTKPKYPSPHSTAPFRSDAACELTAEGCGRAGEV